MNEVCDGIDEGYFVSFGVGFDGGLEVEIVVMILDVMKLGELSVVWSMELEMYGNVCG